jgi:RNA polymerase sigma-70 factor (ECF subfamily)
MGDDSAIELLVDRAREGDAAAFAELYDAFAERLYRFLRFRLGSHEDAEDLLQQVFLKVIQALPRYESRGLPFGAWVFRIARNASTDAVRARRPTMPLEILIGRGDPAGGPEERAAASFEAERIQTALRTLTDEQRDVLAYRFFADLTPGEIAAIMGKREGTIRGLQFRGLRALRRRLETPHREDAAARGTVTAR